ncbi:MAG: hypothetical protein II850_02265 [Fibrobacter sp.]|nr:hypothetical protein [Fibrobacter sp.]
MSKPKVPQVRLLSSLFYERNSDNREILSKQNRPYLVLLVEYRGLKFAIPFNDGFAKNYFVAMKDLCEIAKSLDLLGLVTADAVKDKLHMAVETYQSARKAYEDVYENDNS